MPEERIYMIEREPDPRQPLHAFAFWRGEWRKFDLDVMKLEGQLPWREGVAFLPEFLKQALRCTDKIERLAYWQVPH